LPLNGITLSGGGSLVEESFPEVLRDWLDWDSTAYRLAITLGLMKHEPGLFQGPAKHVFWSNNPVGNMLYGMLDQMVAVGILEKRDEPDIQYRWNPSFRGSWETAG
jgi:hypothetical protein